MIENLTVSKKVAPENKIIKGKIIDKFKGGNKIVIKQTNISVFRGAPIEISACERRKPSEVVGGNPAPSTRRRGNQTLMGREMEMVPNEWISDDN